MMNLEQELLKVTKYAKHKKFPSEWNRSISFIYETFDYEEVIRQAYIMAKKKEFEVNEFVVFTATRWYNYHTNAVLGDFLNEFPEISLNTRSGQTRGLLIKGEAFDYRCTFYPRQFYLPIDYSIEKPKSLLKWFYLNQNRNVYYGNRLFIIFHDKGNPGNSWRLRGRLTNIKNTMHDIFSDGIDLMEFEISKNHATYNPKCAVVFVTANIQDENQNEEVKVPVQLDDQEQTEEENK